MGSSHRYTQQHLQFELTLRLNELHIGSTIKLGNGIVNKSLSHKVRLLTLTLTTNAVNTLSGGCSWHVL